MWSLSRVPGFGGLRDQVKELRTVFMREWRRCRSETEPLPAMPGLVGYVRRTSCESYPLSAIAERLVAGVAGFPNAAKAVPEGERGWVASE